MRNSITLKLDDQLLSDINRLTVDRTVKAGAAISRSLVMRELLERGVAAERQVAPRKDVTAA